MITVKLPNGESVEVDVESEAEAEAVVLDMIEMGELDIDTPEPSKSIGERLYGAGEAALTALSGATTGMVGGIGGTIKQAAQEIGSGEFGTNEAAKRIQQASQEGMAAGTYMPRSEAGRETLQAVDELTKPLQSLPPIMPQVAATGQLGMQAKALGSMTDAAMQPGIQKGVQAAQAISNKVTSKFKRTPDIDDPQMKSMGAAMTPQDQVRAAEAQALRVPVSMTEGEQKRNTTLMKEESELMKMPEGQALRDFVSKRNEKLDLNFEAMIDDLGAMYSEDKPMVGEKLVSVLSDEYKKMKNQVSTTYKLAEMKGAMKEKVSMQGLSDFLNENRAERADTGGIMERVQNKINVMEIGDGDFKNGDLYMGDMSLSQAEDLIQFVNRNVDQSDGREVRMGGRIKAAIDKQTGSIDNKFYKRARSWRVKQAERFEDMQIIQDLISTKKGTNDRKIPIEKVMEKLVFSPSTSNDSLKFVRRALDRAGEPGKEALNELQANALAEIRNKVFNRGNLDESGNAFISAHKLRNMLRPLKESRKMETLFDPAIRKNLEILESVAEAVATSPPGVINTSNTSSALFTIFDLFMASMGSVPVATPLKFVKGKIEDRKLQKRIMQALQQTEKGKSQ